MEAYVQIDVKEEIPVLHFYGRVAKIGVTLKTAHFFGARVWGVDDGTELSNSYPYQAC
jgi:hypothetical protein